MIFFISSGKFPTFSNTENTKLHYCFQVKMVSQGAQTNGFVANGRKLTKSYSEAGCKFGIPRNGDSYQFETIPDHEPLQRTQSDEPPRSPFIVNAPTFSLPEAPQLSQLQPQSDTSSLSNHESEDSAEAKKEIFIDFKPQISPVTGKIMKKSLIKTLSDGEILLEQRKAHKADDCIVPEKPTSHSHENITTEEEQRTFTPYFQTSPIRNEGICEPPDDNVYSSFDTGMYGQDSVDEEFHENLIYNKIYLKRQASSQDLEVITENHIQDESIVPSLCLYPDQKLSPFASNDSLANDIR